MVDIEKIIPILALVTYCGFLITAMIGDIKSFTISNRLNAAFFVSFIIFALLMGISFTQILQHFWIAVIAFLLCFALFAAGLFGGGDVKLVTATCFWLGAAPMYSYAMTTAIFGGILALALLIARKIVKKTGLPRGPKWLRAMLRKRNHIPYGVALGIGGIFAVANSSWFEISTFIIK